MQQDRRTTPYPRTWEIPLTAAMVTGLVLVLAAHLARATANGLSGTGWALPAQAELFTSLPGLPGAGVAAEQGGQAGEKLSLRRQGPAAAGQAVGGAAGQVCGEDQDEPGDHGRGQGDLPGARVRGGSSVLLHGVPPLSVSLSPDAIRGGLGGHVRQPQLVQAVASAVSPA